MAEGQAEDAPLLGGGDSLSPSDCSPDRHPVVVSCGTTTSSSSSVWPSTTTVAAPPPLHCPATDPVPHPWPPDDPHEIPHPWPPDSSTWSRPPPHLDTLNVPAQGDAPKLVRSQSSMDSGCECDGGDGEGASTQETGAPPPSAPHHHHNPHHHPPGDPTTGTQDPAGFSPLSPSQPGGSGPPTPPGPSTQVIVLVTPGGEEGVGGGGGPHDPTYLPHHHYQQHHVPTNLLHHHHHHHHPDLTSCPTCGVDAMGGDVLNQSCICDNKTPMMMTTMTTAATTTTTTTTPPPPPHQHYHRRPPPIAPIHHPHPRHHHLHHHHPPPPPAPHQHHADPHNKVTFMIEDDDDDDDEFDHEGCGFGAGMNAIETASLSGSEPGEDFKEVLKHHAASFPRVPSYSKTGVLSASSSTASMPMCRICHHPQGDGLDTLISPCRCAGTMQFIHQGCLNKWLEVKRCKKAPVCELCNYQFHRHKKFRLNHWQLPSCSRADKILHSVFFVCFVIMVFCATITIICFKQDRPIARRAKDEPELTKSEVVTLTCGVLFFVAFFVAMYVEVKARNTLYRLFTRFLYLNQTWHIAEYDRRRDSQFGHAPV